MIAYTSRLAVGVAAALLVLSSRAPAAAQEEPPLYPEIILETDDGYSADPSLTAFRAALVEASRSRVETPLGKFLQPDAVLPYMADDVEFLIGQKGMSRRREEFVSLGSYPAHRALEMAGRLSRASDSAVPLVHARYGMYVLANLAVEPTAGRTPWLAGRTCTASYGRVSWPDWIALDAKLRLIDRDHWVIASVIAPGETDGPLPAGWPKRWQMVPMAREQKKSAGSLGIVSPDGAVHFFATSFGDHASHFAPYLNSHLCFEKRDRAWKVTAIAMRLD